MYIVIGGAGLTGGRLAGVLAERHDVVVVESDQKRCEQLYAELGVLAVNGSATDIRVLEEAGIQRADVACGTMRQDADNLTFILLAQRFEVKTRIARMGDPRYREAYELAGATHLLNSADMLLREMVFYIEKPAARRITEIGGGEAEMLAIQIPEGAWVEGRTVQEITQAPGFPETCVIAGIFDAERRLTIPRGMAEVRPHSELLVVVRADGIAPLVEFLTRPAR
jgi:trk system potassium uptake protein TrkA